ncbi:uncharacterized protein CG7065-like isoform X2 [Trichoplusia ni]|uniref:Uncharacterized protein CG7065-like isoform X2 n=1 Tax=Trichoplusia ni TaxID=7111 RepID=A0A7E5VDN8_TRINI|nr:uncharacterized protein CG7065-like isoform X2 [Trichoplusia ni]
MDDPDWEIEPFQESLQESVQESEQFDEFEHELSKAERHFNEKLKKLKVRVEDGSARYMVRRRERDPSSGNWVYVCFPCGAVCIGQPVLEAHISGKKHNIKMKNGLPWPVTIFDFHPTKQKKKKVATPQVSTAGSSNNSGETNKYDEYKKANCNLQEALDSLQTALIGLEFVVEHPPEQPHHPPTYICLLCVKQGKSRAIINHINCFWHRYTYLVRFFPTASDKLNPFTTDVRYRTTVAYVVSILARCIEQKYGRKRPLKIEKDEFEREIEQVRRWMAQDHHFSEKDGCTFEEVVNEELIELLVQARKLENSYVDKDKKSPIGSPAKNKDKEDEKSESDDSLPDFDDGDGHHDKSNHETSIALSTINAKFKPKKYYSPWKMSISAAMCAETEAFAKLSLDYHTKNPEKHPFYLTEWSKFWNRRYKEIRAEGKDPAKHDFEPEWVVFWSARMNELHEKELRVQVEDIYRKMEMTPLVWQNNDEQKSRESSPSNKIQKTESSSERLRSSQHQDLRRKSSDRSPHHKTSSGRRNASPDRHIYSSDRRRLTPNRCRPSSPRRRPLLRWSPQHTHRQSPQRRHSPPHYYHSRSRSPHYSWSRRYERPYHALSSSKIDRKPVDGYCSWHFDNDRLSPYSCDAITVTLRQLVALEQYLGSLGPRVMDMLADALKMEKERANSSEELLEREAALVLLETAKEKLKGAAQAGLVAPGAAAAVRAAVVRVAATLHEADKRLSRRKQERLASVVKAVSNAARKGEVNGSQTARQKALTLIARGRIDAKSEELATLVKARQTEQSKLANASCGTPQAAYEKDKESKEDAEIDLSDSEVDTLIENFHQLSSEEQYDFFAYLKKLETKEPHRMDRIIQYVNSTTEPGTPPLSNQSETDSVNNHGQQVTLDDLQSSEHTSTTIKEVGISWAARNDCSTSAYKFNGGDHILFYFRLFVLPCKLIKNLKQKKRKIHHKDGYPKVPRTWPLPEICLS